MVDVRTVAAHKPAVGGGGPLTPKLAMLGTLSFLISVAVAVGWVMYAPVALAATTGRDKSTLTVVGSQLDAGNLATLKADGAVNLLAAENTGKQHSTNSSSGWSVGVGFSLGSTNGFTIDLSANRALGKEDGTSSTWTNTHVTAGKGFHIESGGDTTLKGAVVSAPQITGDIKGNLHIESLQDRQVFDSKQSSSGFAVSLCIPPICYGMSGVGVNAAQTKIGANSTTVNEQSGFKAGDGGYQLKVQGDTQLIGGVIASSDQAIAENKNKFD